MRRVLRTFRSLTIVAALVSLLFYLGASDPQVELETARYALQHHDYDQAMRFARRAALFGDAETGARALATAADAAWRAGHPDTAKAFLDKAVGKWPRCGRCLLLRGELHYRDRAYEQAVSDYTAAFGNGETFAPSEGAYYAARRAIALLRSGKTEAGCKDAEYAVEAYGASPLAHFAKSICLRKRHRIRAAKAEARKAYELGMKTPSFFTRESERMHEDWLRYYTRIRLERERAGGVKSSDELHQRAEALWREGQALYAAGKRDAALKMFQRSYDLEADPDKGSYIAWLMAETQESGEREPSRRDP
jgi:tetratricopeptide (TPR) repeat protein